MTRPFNLLVAGAINTDLVVTMSRAPEAGETITAETYGSFGGGKAANQAVSAARNGADVIMLGACGIDSNGSARIADLQESGIDTSWVRIDRDHPSGVALIFVEAHGENRIAYVPGATRQVPVDHCARCFADTNPDVVLATNELPTECLARLFELSRTADAAVIFNATPDPLKARSLLGNVDVLIVNDGEARQLLGVADTGELSEETIRGLFDSGPDAIVVTLGSAGAIAITADSAYRIAPPKVNVVDTTGAGDAFCGAFAAALGRGESVEVALTYGVFSGALSTETAGAQTSSPTLETIDRVMKQSRA